MAMPVPVAVIVPLTVIASIAGVTGAVPVTMHEGSSFAKDVEADQYM
ncbi:hypothetical protein [Sphaerisporangium aureirubrum]|uniref:Uncharacterized protein n=1 Tax=Sphaerisporangium aureirubrum TaxID=1544736 RepID=A0ABW1NGQ4_9ACTN